MPRLIRSYCETVGLLSRGEFARRLDEELRKLFDAFETMPTDRGKASLTVDLTFKFELGRVDVEAKFKAKPPETDRFMKTPFWLVDNALSVEHPSQLDMFKPRAVADHAETQEA